jgi:hypothetical protein
MCEVKVYIFGNCKCRTSRILLCATAEENNYEPCKRQTPADKDFSNGKARCPYHQNLFEMQSQENNQGKQEEGKNTPHDKDVGIIRSFSKDETWYFSPKESGAGRITVDHKGEERRFPAKSPEPVKKIRVRIAIPPPPPPPPAL